ncbi:Thioredoxin-1 [Arthrobacter saudimassiliensis]|uniref:Thioredoxin-1 n=1 Tax=Arthrobacter saudimassiliensis TaxID=1461584 RepID=A0A078MUP9_9MICC|nr:Thioredoxin-1 [Arthrobacter saudimassiliensis]
MSIPNGRPAPGPSASMNLRGAVDLSALKARASAPAPSPGGSAEAGAGASAWTAEVNEQTFPQVIQVSSQVPVLIDLYSADLEASRQVSQALAGITASLGGRVLLARVDVNAYPQIAQAFQAVAVPTVAAVLKGQPVPLFEGPVPEDQIRGVIDELLRVAEANGVTGSLGADAGTGAADEAEEPPLPPLHQEAYDAIVAGNYQGAAEAYRKALAEQPADAEARAGLAQVELMGRLQGVDAQQLRDNAAQNPDDVDAQLAVADLDVSGGHVDDAFNRLVRLVARTAGEDRERTRLRLLDLFEVVGTADPRVTKARSALARALF